MKFLLAHLFLLCWSSFGISTANVLITTQSNEQILRVSTKHFPPFMYGDSKGNFYNGIDFELVRAIAKVLNMRLHFRNISKRSELCQNVAINDSDICIGGIFPSEDTSKYALMSVTYASDDLTWCVRKAAIMPTFLAQVSFMQPGIYFLLIFCVAYPVGFLLYLLIQFDRKYEQRNNRDWNYTGWLIGLPAVIGMSPNFRPVSCITRTFFAFVLVTAFFLFQIIFTRVYDFLHIQMSWRQISSFNEIVQKDFEFVGSMEAFNLLNRSKKIPNQKLGSFQICEEANECLFQLLNRNKLAIGGSRQNILNSPLNSHSKVFCFRELDNIAIYPVAFYTRRDFNLNEKVNGILQRLFEGGFFVKWKKDAQLKRPYEIPYTIPHRLPITHIVAAMLFILTCGSFVSFSTFVVEKFVWWKLKQNTGHKFWIFMEKCVDGKRHYFKNLPERLQWHHQHTETHFSYLDIEDHTNSSHTLLDVRGISQKRERVKSVHTLKKFKL